VGTIGPIPQKAEADPSCKEHLVPDLKVVEKAAPLRDCAEGPPTTSEIIEGTQADGKAEEEEGGLLDPSRLPALGLGLGELVEGARHSDSVQVHDRWTAPALIPEDTIPQHSKPERHVPAVTEGKLGCVAYLTPHPLLDPDVDPGLSGKAEAPDAPSGLGTRTSKRTRRVRYSRWGRDEFERENEEVDGLTEGEEEEAHDQSNNQRTAARVGGKGKLKGEVVGVVGVAQQLVQEDAKPEDEDEEFFEEFGHGLFERRHTLQSFMAYAEWSKATHFGPPAGSGAAAGASGSRGSWVPANWLETPWLHSSKRLHDEVADKKAMLSPARLGRVQSSGQGCEASAREEGVGEVEAVKSEKSMAGDSSTYPEAAAASRRLTRQQKQVSARIEEESKGPSIAELEAEFWRIIETASPGKVETLYGSDLDSGRY
jgi:hypothetical protein